MPIRAGIHTRPNRSPKVFQECLGILKKILRFVLCRWKHKAPIIE